MFQAMIALSQKYTIPKHAMRDQAEKDREREGQRERERERERKIKRSGVFVEFDGAFVRGGAATTCWPHRSGLLRATSEIIPSCRRTGISSMFPRSSEPDP